MKHGHSCNTPDELEIGEVILVAQARVGINLESVVVSGETQDESTQEESHLNTAFLNATVRFVSRFISVYRCLKKVNKHNIFTENSILFVAASYRGEQITKK